MSLKTVVIRQNNEYHDCIKLKNVIGNCKMQHKRLSICTLITHFLIVIAVGHGGGTIGLLEIFSILNLLGVDDSFTMENLTTSSLFWSIVLVLIGQALVITTLFKKMQHWVHLKLMGIMLLLVSYIFLLAFVWDEGTASVSIVSGTPFLVLSVILIYKHLSSKYEITDGET